MTKRTPVQFRRQLLEVLRKIRDEGPIRPDFGLWFNIDEMMKCTTMVEFIVVDILINRSGGVNKTSWVGDVWKNPHMLSVMHKMISFLENDDRYVWMKPSRHELQQTENMLLKKEIAELKQKLEPFIVYQCREIGEGDFVTCSKERFIYCQKSPEHDTRWSVICSKGERVSYPSGQGVLITPDQDVNGVVIALDDDGAYRRVHSSNIVKGDL